MRQKIHYLVCVALSVKNIKLCHFQEEMHGMEINVDAGKQKGNSNVWLDHINYLLSLSKVRPNEDAEKEGRLLSNFTSI